MQCTDGFRRRAAIVANNKGTNSPAETRCNTEDRFGKDNFIKFSKINASNHAILNSRKKDQEFQRTIKDIQKRKCTFYRMGFRSYQKQGQKKIFSQVLGLSSGQMKGSMFTGQLWANHEVGRYLKQNKIFMTKLKLMDRMQVLKKQMRQAQKNDADTDSEMGASTRSIGTCHSLAFRSVERPSNTSSVGRIQFQQNIENIKGELKKLKKTRGKHCLDHQIQDLEKCKENMDRMQRKYYLGMIDLD